MRSCLGQLAFCLFCSFQNQLSTGPIDLTPLGRSQKRRGVGGTFRSPQDFLGLCSAKSMLKYALRKAPCNNCLAP